MLKLRSMIQSGANRQTDQGKCWRGDPAETPGGGERDRDQAKREQIEQESFQAPDEADGNREDRQTEEKRGLRSQSEIFVGLARALFDPFPEMGRALLRRTGSWRS